MGDCPALPLRPGKAPVVMPTGTAPPTPDLELVREQDYLARARTELARMRDKTLHTERAAGDAVSDAFLANTLARRAASLVDDPTSTLFFGRLDLEGAPAQEHGRERWYVGRRHVNDELGDPVVIDWRAELSGAFYRASRAEPMHVSLRRRFGIDRGRLTAFEDEHLQDAGELDVRSDILMAEIERPRVGPMRDIVATIQPEQDEIVRADAATTICVQGAPGTGKTAVGLHRAAWLLYAFRDKLARSGVLVVGPNRAFLDHIGAVLPALGEIDVQHTTAEELVASVPVKGSDSTAAAVLKGDARLAEVLRRAVWARVRPATEPLIVPRGARRWRVPAYEVAGIIDELRARSVRYEAARAILPQRLAHHVLLEIERSGDSPDDRVQDAIARGAPVKAYAATLWPAVDPRAVLFGLWSDPAVLADHADGLLTPDEQLCCGTNLLAPREQPGGRLRTPSCSTRSPTSASARRASGTSSSTRPRISRRCSCAPSDAGARRGRRRCSATSRRAPRRGRRRRGRSPSNTSASRTATSRSSTADSGCRPW